MSSNVPDLPPQYYDFGRYVDRARWLTYYRQLITILPTAPQRVLEIGVGPGVVRAVLRDRGVHVETVDVNDALGVDHVADVRALPNAITSTRWDWVLCSRVLHHVPVDEVDGALAQLASLDVGQTLLSVPREDLSFQVTFRRTAGRARHLRLSGGMRLKRALRRRRVIRTDPSGLWMLGGDNGLGRDRFRSMLAAKFHVHEEFVLEDDPSHVFYVLGPRRP